MAGENQTDWSGLIGSLLAAYLGRGTAGDTPNFYPIPQTPEDKRWDDERWRVYSEGGSPQMRATADAARQFFDGMPTTANPTFASKAMQGQAFAGGVQLPRVTLPQMSRPNAGVTPPTGPGNPDRPGDEREGARDAGNEDPLNPRGGNGPFGPSPYGLDDMPTSGDFGVPAQTPGEFGKALGDLPQRFGAWWERFKTEHPNYARYGMGGIMALASAALGAPASAISALVKTVFGQRGNGTATAPTAPIDDFYNTPPGSPSKYGSAYGEGEKPPGYSGGGWSGYGAGAARRTGFEDFGQPGGVAEAAGYNKPAPAPRSYGIDPSTGRVYDSGGVSGQQGAYQAQWNWNLAHGGSPYGQSKVMQTRMNRGAGGGGMAGGRR